MSLISMLSLDYFDGGAELEFMTNSTRPGALDRKILKDRSDVLLNKLFCGWCPFTCCVHLGVEFL